MHKPKRLSDKMKHKRPPADWCGLSNEPRNKNLDGMPDLSFAKGSPD